MTHFVVSHLLSLAALSIKPSNALPINNPLNLLLDGIAGLILTLGGIGFMGGVGLKAIGAHAGNFGLSDRGGSMMFWGGLAAALSGACAVIINYLYHLGQQAH